MATAVTYSSFKDGHGCSICLDEFTSPRQLPCLHSFCEHCLQDYITKKASSTDKTLVEFMCPVCRALTRPANKEKPVREWASLFPNSPIPLVGKSKVERFCEVCLNSSDSAESHAKKFCIVCEEFMCNNCAVCHQNMKMTKSHKIITMEEYENNPDNRIRFWEGFGCPEHDNEDIKFYCRSHKSACCGTCFFHHHKACQNVIELKENLPSLLKEINAQKIKEQMRKLEDHLKEFMETNEASIRTVESQVKNISTELGDIRRKFMALLDDIEKMVKLEGNRIYKEWLIRKQEQNHQCLSLVSAIRNSHALLKTVDQFGSDTQKLLVTIKTKKQLQCYSDQIREKFERVDYIRIRLELDSNIKAVLSKDAGGLVKLVCEEEAKAVIYTSLAIPLQTTNMELSGVIDVQFPSDRNPSYVGIIQLPVGYIILADNNNNKCSLYDSLHNLITSHNLPGDPLGMCLIGDHEVAVTIPDTKTVQFLSIMGRSIGDRGSLKAKYIPCGVDAVSSEEIVVSGHIGDKWYNESKKFYWSLITRNGKVKLHHEFDCQGTYHSYTAIDSSKSRVYISVSGDNAVYCFDLTDGKQYFRYLSSDLEFPLGVAVDREDNVYVVGHNSNNIHKLSTNGVTLQVITSGVPRNPVGISFSYSRDHFIITNMSKNNKLYCFA
ncbi:hypothetical protein CHS0354_032144 [Potamilus streckersoni]|uniref:Uncharacterized protein n=1 Tax=Potamilus streckersoni TaxID=2493646 RepID=A0AAE0TGR6_9BIVA|nr:hypothetical protein CHS0354_032144 [Potamilus streckersoni]